MVKLWKDGKLQDMPEEPLMVDLSSVSDMQAAAFLLAAAMRLWRLPKEECIAALQLGRAFVNVRRKAPEDGGEDDGKGEV